MFIKVLNQTENAYVLQNLLNRQISQATAVIELLIADGQQWNRSGEGALCFIKVFTE